MNATGNIYDEQRKKVAAAYPPSGNTLARRGLRTLNENVLPVTRNALDTAARRSEAAFNSGNYAGAAGSLLRGAAETVGSIPLDAYEYLRRGVSAVSPTATRFAEGASGNPTAVSDGLETPERTTLRSAPTIPVSDGLETPERVGLAPATQSAAEGWNPSRVRRIVDDQGRTTYTNAPGNEGTVITPENSRGTVNSMPAANFARISPSQSQELSDARFEAARRGDFDAVRRSYQTGLDRESAGPRGGSIGGSGRYGLRFARRSEDRAADRAQRERAMQLSAEQSERAFNADQANREADLGLRARAAEREDLRLLNDVLPKPLTEAQQYANSVARANAVNAELTRLGVEEGSPLRQRLLQNYGGQGGITSITPENMPGEIARAVQQDRVRQARDQFSIGGLRSASMFDPNRAEEDEFRLRDWWAGGPNAPGFLETLLSNTGDVVEEGGIRVNRKGLRKAEKDLDVLRQFNVRDR